MSYFFDGVDDYMETTAGGHTSFQPEASHTQMAWIKWHPDMETSWPATAQVFGANAFEETAGLSIALSGLDNRLSVVSRIGSSTIGTSLPISAISFDEWHCVFHYYEQNVSNYRRYRTYNSAATLTSSVTDGTAQSGTVNYEGGQHPARFGRAGPTSLAYKGHIAHCAVWHRRLSFTEMLQLASGANPRDYPTDLGEYWPLTGNNHLKGIIAGQHLTNFGAALSSDNPPVDYVDKDYLIFRRTPSTGEPFDPNVDIPVATVPSTELSYIDENLPQGEYDWQIFARKIETEVE